jgi:hypothetical protein
MIYDESTHELVFSTGKRVYCFAGILGLASAERPQVSPVQYGSDGDLDTDSLSPEERLELADELVSRAIRFRDSLIK